MLSPDGRVLEYDGIPSSVSLLTVVATNPEDVAQYRTKRKAKQQQALKNFKEDIKEAEVDAKEPEAHLKAMLPTFTPQEIETMKIAAPLDFEEALYFGESKYASISRYYGSLERIVALEWFINKL